MSNNDENIRKAADEEAAQLAGIFSATQAAEIEAGCKSLFALYTGYMKAGFNPEQALRLVIATIQMPQVGKGKGE